MSKVDQILEGMRQSGKMRDWKSKGNQGEDAVLAIMHEYYLKRGGLLYQSFTYPYASNSHSQVYLGNIFRRNDGTYIDVTKQFNDEIDILYVSPYRIFPIEVKAYHAKMEMSIDGLKKNGSIQYEKNERTGDMLHKNPLWQAEKHARHLYHNIYDVIPDGNPYYIQPIVCFADRCELSDTRTPEGKFYLPVTILNYLKQCIMDCDTPMNYRLDLAAIEKKLVSIKKDVRSESKEFSDNLGVFK